jgi:quercetin dioxygenase-like cupin family protein
MNKTLKALLIAAACVATAGAVGPAFAGECPAASVRVDATPPGPMAPKDVTDTVIASIDLGQGYGVPGRMLRMRRLVMKPGAIVPWHSHADRPANIYVVSGTVVEHRSNCAVPIIHRAGDVVAEQGAISHWWKNESGKHTAVLISSDIPPAAKPADMGM